MDIVSFIISLIGTVVGIIGLMISFVTWTNTKNIQKAIISEKIKEIYPNVHREFSLSVDTAIASLREGGKKYYIVDDLIKTCKSIQAFYDSWDKKQQFLIDDFLKNLEDISDHDIDNQTRKYILSKLYDIKPQLERIGNINGVR